DARGPWARAGRAATVHASVFLRAHADVAQLSAARHDEIPAKAAPSRVHCRRRAERSTCTGWRPERRREVDIEAIGSAGAGVVDCDRQEVVLDILDRHATDLRD